jgi:hypothetical protein
MPGAILCLTGFNMNSRATMNVSIIKAITDHILKNNGIAAHVVMVMAASIIKHPTIHIFAPTLVVLDVMTFWVSNPYHLPKLSNLVGDFPPSHDWQWG